ncbi:hypothetical protein GN956_G3456 [Arapaima gigas]
MDEYEEMYGIEDDFEQQFADELEVVAELDSDDPQGGPLCPSTGRSPPRGKLSAWRIREPRSFEEALASADELLGAQSTTSTHSAPGGLQGTTGLTAEETKELEAFTGKQESLTPKPKRRRQDVAKKLQFGCTDDEWDDARVHSRWGIVTLQHSCTLDISGLVALPSPSRSIDTSQKHVLRRPPPMGDFITVTDSAGNRVYLAQKEEEDPTKAVDARALRNSHYSLGLLSVPVEVLREQVAEKHHQQLVEESQRLTNMLSRRLDGDSRVMDSAELLDDEQEAVEDGKDAASLLWVDRFSPTRYTELLSDDFTNRCLLKWLKLWDTVVFGREKPSRKTKAPQADGRLQSKEQQNSRFKSKTQMTEEILEAELDQYHRPKYKVALLSGPPGLGKTTLAHIIAKHAGYNVVEMNASDDRSAELFQKRIDMATQMKSVLGANEKPNCLVIDEIDGAPSAAINVLLATLNRKESWDTDSEASGVTALKKKKKKESVLLRPIICICNDLYVPALRQLRQQAFILNFPQTQPSRLIQRLAEISRHQGMRVETGALMALCEKTDNDIRSCINTLQFLHGRGQRQLDQRAIQSVKVGLKDQNKGLFSIWQEIFQLPRTKRKRIGNNGFSAAEVGSLSSAGDQRLQHIVHLASSSGEQEKLTNGLYDNFLSMKLKDPSLRGVCQALEWLSFSDLLNEAVMHLQNFSLARYLPFLPAAFHLLFAATSVPRISYPNSQYEAIAKMQHTKNALVALLAEVPPSIRSRVDPRCLSMDILSLLLDIICPKLRPVNPQLYSTREKQQLVELIDTMLCYSLTYRQDRTPEGQYIYLLEPNVEEAVRFPGVPPRRQLTYQAKQMIARELELERMRRAEAALLSRNLPQEENQEKETKTEATKGKVDQAGVRNHQQRLENIIKQTVTETKPEVDFFGRVIVLKEKPEVNKASGEPEKVNAELLMGRAVSNSDVWFRFNEGVSNAVRRNVYVKELL